jgi:1-deoxy-D-xylulose 5-phosphate reductoisomerase
MSKKKIAILGSTGSIGKTTLQILKFNKKKFDIILLSANSNYLEIKNQIKKIKPRYFVVNDLHVYRKLLKNKKRIKTKILNKFSEVPSKIKI